MNPSVQTLSLRDEDKARLRLLFLAKHALSAGQPSPEDGNHACYHHELLTTMRAIGLNVTPAVSYDSLCGQPETDFVVTLLNRGGFLNSEMLAPLMATWKRLPHLGASPIIRGLGDDKHLSKRVAVARGEPVARWLMLRRGGLPFDSPFPADRYVVKPNASSASWGVRMCDDWSTALVHASAIMEQGHDALIEEWQPLFDVAVPVIGGPGGRPQLLPAMLFRNEDPLAFRSYEEKRGLGLTGAGEDDLVALDAPTAVERINAMVQALLPEFWPFDYGRFEFRFDPRDGAVSFMEVNLSCNLWSRKSVSRAARLVGIDHQRLVETILAHSLERQGLLAREVSGIAA